MWKHVLHGCFINASLILLWNNCFPGGINQWALSLDRVQRKDPTKADPLSRNDLVMISPKIGHKPAWETQGTRDKA